MGITLSNAGDVRNESLGLQMDKFPSQEKRIYDCLRDVGPSTAQQLAMMLKMRYTSVHGRINGLIKKHLVKDSGKTMLNADTGMQNTLWELTGEMWFK